MSLAQVSLPLAAAVMLSLLGLPRWPGRRGAAGGPSVLSRWALFAWMHPMLAACLRAGLFAAALAAALVVCWPWVGRPGDWVATFDAAAAAARRLWAAPS